MECFNEISYSKQICFYFLVCLIPPCNIFSGCGEGVVKAVPVAARCRKTASAHPDRLKIIRSITYPGLATSAAEDRCPILSTCPLQPTRPVAERACPVRYLKCLFTVVLRPQSLLRHVGSFCCI